jgi:octaprenyl-diphosphate synthase
MESYGYHIGMAFQIADDVLDIWGDERATGKSLGTDLEKQKLTLPIIRLLEVGEPTAVAEARLLLQEARAASRRRLQPLLEESGALDYAWGQARAHVERAVTGLDAASSSPYKDILAEMAEYVLRRSS